MNTTLTQPVVTGLDFQQIFGDYEMPWYGGAVWHDKARHELLCWEGVGDGGCEMFPVIMGVQRVSISDTGVQIYYQDQLLSLDEYCQAQGRPAPQNESERLSTLLDLIARDGFSSFFRNGLSLGYEPVTEAEIDRYIEQAQGSPKPADTRPQRSPRHIAGDEDDLSF